MEQKRFLTAGEVFQLFGVDADALDQLVQSGEVKALPDQGSFRYRSVDFVNLVNQGKLSPRTSGEMFQVDSKGDIPFLTIKDEDKALKFNEDVTFLEIDEDALNEHAGQSQPTPATPVVPENWFDDIESSDDAIKTTDTSDEIHLMGGESGGATERTDFELNIGPEIGGSDDSDSNVRIVEDDGGIDFDEPDVESSGSDSDVRLEGPVSFPSSPPASARKKPGSDSDVRLSKFAASGRKSDSDSDVTIAPTAKSSASSDAPASIPFAQPISKKPDSDSDVQLASPVATASDVIVGQPVVGGVAGTHDSDSDVVLVATPVGGAAGDLSPAKKADSDSDVQLVTTDAELDMMNPVASNESSSALDDVADEFAKLDDSNVRIESALDFAPGQSPAPRVEASEATSALDDDDSGIRFEMSDSGISLEAADLPKFQDKTGVKLGVEDDSGISIEPSALDSGIALENRKTDSDIAIESATADSGLALEASVHDSGLALDSSPADSGISLEGSQLDSGISISATGHDSGISLDHKMGRGGTDFHQPDSGIQLSQAHSGIALGQDAVDTSQTMVELDADQDFEHFAPGANDGSMTQTIEVTEQHPQDSGFDVSLGGDHTMEMDFSDDEDESSGAAATVVNKGRSKSLSLSEAFQLDEPLEVEDLEISEDLDAAAESEYSGEFAEAEEEVFEASDADFSGDEVSAAEDVEEGDSEAFVPAAKVRTGPREPAWGLGAVVPIGLASVVMLATATVLWGGIATMWTGGEAPGPAGMLISTLAGLL